MGNTIGRGKKAKVMKINGEMFKLKTPVRAWDVVKDYPGHVLLESDAVKHFGVRTKPLEPQEELKPRKIYFLVELPKFPEEKETRTRRVRSGIHMSAKDRLECLMLSRRAASDLSVARPPLSSRAPGEIGPSGGPVRVKVRLPKAQLEKLMEEGKDDAEMGQKIVELYMENTGEADGNGHHRNVQWNSELGSNTESFKATQESLICCMQKRVSFVLDEGKFGLDVASH